MDVSFGLSKKIVVIIPTRGLNEITKNNLCIIQQIFLECNLEFEIIIVSNNIDDHAVDGVKLYYNIHRNAAISRNLGLSKCFLHNGVFIFLDDDIVIEFDEFYKLITYVIENNNEEILAPYLSGFYLKDDYKFNIGIAWFYSWLSSKNIKYYHDLQGKSFYSYNFSPLYVKRENLVEWATGGFLVFNNFKKDKIRFNENIFSKFYHLEDFYITHEIFLNGIKIKLLPIIFSHINLSTTKNNNTFKHYFSVCFNLELNRLKIQKLNIKRTDENLFKFKLSLFLFYLYRLMRFTKKNFAEFLAIIYLCLLRHQKY